MLDAFAGTGALGLEALSRGAAHATFLDRDPAALATLRANVATLGAERRVAIRQADTTRPPPGTSCDVVFLDPPYGAGLVGRALPALAAGGWVGTGALVVAETGLDEELGLAPLFDRVHGAARLRAWRMA